MKKGQQIVFCEVKYRPTAAIGAESLSRHQQNRIINGAKHFLLCHPNYANHNLRFDAVLCHPKGLRHEKNAWQCDVMY